MFWNRMLLSKKLTGVRICYANAIYLKFLMNPHQNLTKIASSFRNQIDKENFIKKNNEFKYEEKKQK